MKTISLMRHSFAEAGYGKPDFERGITQEGYRRIELQAQAFPQLKLPLELCICSSARRTKETAQHFLQCLGVQPPVIEEQQFYQEYTTQDFLDYISALDDHIAHVLVVGHNPSISQLAIRLSSKGMWNFNPATILRLSFPVLQWRKIEVGTGVPKVIL